MPVVISQDAINVIRVAPKGQPRMQSILFIHGMWDGGWVWSNYLDYFSARGYECYALTLRGRPTSRPLADIGSVSIYDYVDDARGVAETIGNPIIIGHSMGGLITQKLAEELDPPAVVAVTPAAPRGIFALRTRILLAAAFRHLPDILLHRPVLPSKAIINRLVHNGLPREEQDRLYGLLVSESGRMIFDIAFAGLRVETTRIRCPMLVISASNDRAASPGMERHVAKKFGAELHQYPGFAHMVPLEPGWEDPACDIATWLEKVVSDGPDSGFVREYRKPRTATPPHLASHA